jgi:hypothetical protein
LSQSKEAAGVKSPSELGLPTGPPAKSAGVAGELGILDDGAEKVKAVKAAKAEASAAVADGLARAEEAKK